MTTEPASVYRVLAAMAIGLGIPPLCWHIRSPNKNIPVIILICWTLLQNIIKFTNSFFWYSDGDLWDSWDGTYYCDIVIKLDIVGKAGQLASVVAVMRTIAVMLRPRQRRLQIHQITKTVWEDVTICLAFPLAMGAAHYYVQPSRYDIYTLTGCSPIIDNSLPSFWLFFIWPPILAGISSLYAVYILWRVYRWHVSKKERPFRRAIVWRLFIMASGVLFMLFPVIVTTFISNWNAEYLPYDWDAVHGEDWLNIVKYATGNGTNFEDWISILSTFIIFAAYGVGGDARHMYRSWAEKVHLEKIYDTRSVVSSFTSGQLRKMREAIEARETESPIVLGENERTLSAHLRSLVWPFEGDSYAFHSAPDSALLTGSRNSFRSWRRESLDQPTRRRRTSSTSSIKSFKSMFSIGSDKSKEFDDDGIEFDHLPRQQLGNVQIDPGGPSNSYPT